VSFHVTGNSQNIQQLNHFEGPDQIYIGNGEGLKFLVMVLLVSRILTCKAPRLGALIPT